MVHIHIERRRRSVEREATPIEKRPEGILPTGLYSVVINIIQVINDRRKGIENRQVLANKSFL
jgi:hypothetical protein